MTYRDSYDPSKVGAVDAGVDLRLAAAENDERGF
jgi:hypothetical protein